MNNELDKKKEEFLELCDLAYNVAFNAGVEHGKHSGFREGESAGHEKGYNRGLVEGAEAGYRKGLKECEGGYVEGYSNGFDAAAKEFGNASKRAALRDQDSFTSQYGFQNFSDLTGQANECDSTHEVQLLGRTKWNAWPMMLRHDYVHARLCNGEPSVQIVVNGEQIGVVTPSGGLLVPRYSDYLRFKSLAMHVAKHDSECDHATNVIVPDSKVGLFLLIDSRGNEFELKNTEYGTVIVKGDIVLGVVSSMAVIKHAHGALQQCEEYGKLTQAVFAFCKWACDIDHRALPMFMVRKVAIEGQRGFSVRADDSGRFEVLDITGTVGVILNPHINGTFGVLSVDAPLEPRTREIVEAAKRTVRSKFYGDMAL